MAGARGATATTDSRSPHSASTTLRSVADSSERAGPQSARTRRTRSDRLSRKERMVLAELARGNSTEEIGMALGVSPHTVRTHVKNLMRKLGARTRAHAVAIALLEHAIEIRP
jgi:DNA-binding CsgD family transcriptional regulator